MSDINAYTNCEYCGATLQEGEDCICKSEEPENGFVEYGKKLEILGKKMQDHKTTMDELVSLCFECGLELCFSIRGK